MAKAFRDLCGTTKKSRPPRDGITRDTTLFASSKLATSAGSGANTLISPRPITLPLRKPLLKQNALSGLRLGNDGILARHCLLAPTAGSLKMGMDRSVSVFAFQI